MKHKLLKVFANLKSWRIAKSLKFLKNNNLRTYHMYSIQVNVSLNYMFVKKNDTLYLKIYLL